MVAVNSDGERAQNKRDDTSRAGTAERAAIVRLPSAQLPGISAVVVEMSHIVTTYWVAQINQLRLERLEKRKCQIGRRL